MTTPRARSHSKSPEGGFLQWRPVTYLTSDRDVNKASVPSFSRPSDKVNATETPATRSTPSIFDELSADLGSELEPLTNITSSLQHSLAYALLGDNLTNLLAAETLVSFGDPEDGWYTYYNYTVW